MGGHRLYRMKLGKHFFAVVHLITNLIHMLYQNIYSIVCTLQDTVKYIFVSAQIDVRVLLIYFGHLHIDVQVLHHILYSILGAKM